MTGWFLKRLHGERIHALGQALNQTELPAYIMHDSVDGNSRVKLTPFIVHVPFVVVASSRRLHYRRMLLHIWGIAGSP